MVTLTPPPDALLPRRAGVALTSVTHRDDAVDGTQSQAALTVATMTSKVNGKTGTLTPCRSETPENIITKIGHIYYVAGGNTHAKFYGNRPRGVRPTNSQNITSCDFVYLPFPFLSFIFLVVAYSNKKAVLSQGIRAMPL